MVYRGHTYFVNALNFIQCHVMRFVFIIDKISINYFKVFHYINDVLHHLNKMYICFYGLREKHLG